MVARHHATKFRGRPASQIAPGALSDEDIATLLQAKIGTALNRDDGELSSVRQGIDKMYRGGPIGEEGEEGRSTYRPREVFELVEWTLPSMLSSFFSAAKPVVFDPVTPDDVPVADQETNTVHHYMFRKENSFIEFHNWFKAGLRHPVAYAKVHVVYVEQQVPHKYEEITDQQLAELVEPRRWLDDNYTVELVRTDPVLGPIHRFEGIEVREKPQFRFEVVEPESMLIDQAARHLDLDEVYEDSHAIIHRATWTYSDLRQRNPDIYTEERLDEVTGREERSKYNEETTQRKYREDERPEEHAGDWASKPITVYECYMKLDVDGDGISENRFITMISGEIFENELEVYQPFVALSFIPEPFKHAGMSPAESIADMQELSTMLQRLMIDTLHQDATPRFVVSRHAMLGSKLTSEQVLDTDNAIVEVNDAPGNAVMPFPKSGSLPDLLAFMSYTDDKLKKRSGSAPEAFLNTDAQRDGTAHGALLAVDKGSQRLMHWVRIAAETGVKKVAKKFHHCLRKHQDTTMMLRLNGEFVPVNPASWQEREDVTVTVGLGFTTKQEKLMALSSIVPLLEKAAGMGGVDSQHFAHLLAVMVEEADLGFPVQFRKDAPWQAPPPPPDPQMAAVEASKEIEQLRNQGKMAEIQSKEKTALAIEQTKQKAHEVELARLKVEAIKASRQNNLAEAIAREEAKKVDAETQRILEEAPLTQAKTLKERALADKALADAELARKQPATPAKGDD